MPQGVDDPNCTVGNWNWIGTDDQTRDVMARVIYGFRISVLFGLILTLGSAVVGVSAGAIQGYFGGWTDLLFQRFIEIWSALPLLYLLMIVAAILPPGFFILLGLMLLFSWVNFVPSCARNFCGRVTSNMSTPRGRWACEQHDHIPALAAQCHGGDVDLPAVHPQRLDHGADLA